MAILSLLSKSSNLKVRMMPTQIALIIPTGEKGGRKLKRLSDKNLVRSDSAGIIPFFNEQTGTPFKLPARSWEHFFAKLISDLAKKSDKRFIIMEKNRPANRSRAGLIYRRINPETKWKVTRRRERKPPARYIKGQRVLQLCAVDLEIIFTTTPCLDLAVGSTNWPF